MIAEHIVARKHNKVRFNLIIHLVEHGDHGVVGKRKILRVTDLHNGQTAVFETNILHHFSSCIVTEFKSLLVELYKLRCNKLLDLCDPFVVFNVEILGESAHQNDIDSLRRACFVCK